MSKKSQASGYAARARKKKGKKQVVVPSSPYQGPASVASPTEAAKESSAPSVTRVSRVVASKRIVTPANPYLIRELTQIGITAGAMFAILVLLSFLLR